LGRRSSAKPLPFRTARESAGAGRDRRASAGYITGATIVVDGGVLIT
jgi:hypothetical protein